MLPSAPAITTARSSTGRSAWVTSACEDWMGAPGSAADLVARQGREAAADDRPGRVERVAGIDNLLRAAAGRGDDAQVGGEPLQAAAAVGQRLGHVARLGVGVVDAGPEHRRAGRADPRRERRLGHAPHLVHEPEQLGGAGLDVGEGVVDLVGQARGQGSHRGHLLGAHQLVPGVAQGQVGALQLVRPLLQGHQHPAQPDQRGHARQELARPDGLHQVVVGPGLEPVGARLRSPRRWSPARRARPPWTGGRGRRGRARSPTSPGAGDPRG